MIAAAVLMACSYPVDFFLVHACSDAITVVVSGGDNDTKPTRSVVQPNEPTLVHATCCGPQDSFTVTVGAWSRVVDPKSFVEDSPYALPLEACP